MCCYVDPAIDEKLIPSIIKVLMCTMCVIRYWQKCPSPRLRDLLIIDLYAYAFLEISVSLLIECTVVHRISCTPSFYAVTS